MPRPQRRRSTALRTFLRAGVDDLPGAFDASLADIQQFGGTGLRHIAIWRKVSARALAHGSPACLTRPKPARLRAFPCPPDVRKTSVGECLDLSLGATERCFDPRPREGATYVPTIVLRELPIC
jgi:hypothetical protein